MLNKQTNQEKDNYPAVITFVACTKRIFAKVDCDCNLPSQLVDAWWDSGAGEVVFTYSTKQLTGWSFKVYTQTFSIFICVEADDTIFLFKTDGMATLFQDNYVGFLCIQYTKITDNSYRYYLLSNEEPEEELNRRVKMINHNEVTAPYDINNICNPTNGPGVEEYHVLVKQGKKSSINQFLPDLLLGTFSYTVSDGAASYCGAGSVCDSCTNRTSIYLNYTQCNTRMFDSDSGVLTSTTFVSSGSNYFVSVITSDDDTTSFTCLAVAASSNKVLMSTNPGSCSKQQTPYSSTNSVNSVTLTLIPYAVCPFNDDKTTTSSSSDKNMSAILAGVLIPICLVIIAISAFVVYRRIVRRKSHIRNFHRPPHSTVAAPSLTHASGDQHCHRLSDNNIPDFIYGSKSPVPDSNIEEVILQTPRVYQTKAVYIS